MDLERQDTVESSASLVACTDQAARPTDLFTGAEAMRLGQHARKVQALTLRCLVIAICDWCTRDCLSARGSRRDAATNSVLANHQPVQSRIYTLCLFLTLSY